MVATTTGYHPQLPQISGTDVVTQAVVKAIIYQALLSLAVSGLNCKGWKLTRLGVN